MKKLLKILQRLLGISPAEYSAEPPIVKPQTQTVESSITIAEPQPDGDGWYHEPWGKRRPVKGCMRSGMLMLEDEPPSNNLAIRRPNRR